MIRAAYALLWLLAMPAAALRLWWRGRRQPGYRERIGERFGRYAPAPAGPRIWVHAVSLGETRAAAPVIAMLAARFPDHRILVTHMTPTGRAAGLELFGDRVERAWLPYDHALAVRRFVAHFRPRFGILMETELWPRLLEECARAGIPVVLANARLSERSARGYARVPALARWALGNLAGVAAQTDADARRLAALGARRVTVTGNVKFDQPVPADTGGRAAALRALAGEGRVLWVAGSTRDGEEALLLDAFAAASPAPKVSLVLVPRHPQRFDEVAGLAAARGFAVARRSANRPAPEARVWIGDSMGEMAAYYGAADVVIMGGSLLPFGSQNLIEPCALGKPVLVGPSTYNFAEAARGAVQAGAALAVADAREAIAAAAALTADPARREAMGRQGVAFVAAHRGAVARFGDWLEETLREAASGRAPG